MGQVILSISSLLLGIALIFLGHGMLGTLLPLRMGMAEFAPFVVGMVMSAYFVGQIVGVFLGSRLIANVGHVRTFAALASILSATAVAHPFLIAPCPGARSGWSMGSASPASSCARKAGSTNGPPTRSGAGYFPFT